jgi:hypothetical protein
MATAVAIFFAVVQSAPRRGTIEAAPRNTLLLASPLMKRLGLLLLTVAAFSVSAAEPLPAQYSFNDLYRLTVGGPPLGAALPAAEAPLRVAFAGAAAPAEPRFTVRFPAPERWLLVLAGLALAGWVAHRRLSYL